MPDNNTPFEGENNIQSAEIIPMNRVEAMATLARQSFKNCIVEYGGEEKMKEMKKQANAALKLPIDASSLDAVKKAKMLYVKARTSLDDTKDKIKRDIIDAGKAVEEIRKEFGKPFAEVEEKLATRQKEIETAAKAEQERLEREKKERTDARLERIKSAGAAWNGQWYGINDITVDIMTIENAPDDLFADLEAKIKAQFEINEAARIAKEKADQEERDRLKAEQDRLAKEKAGFEAQQEAFRKQQDELKAQQDALKAQQEKAEMEKKEREEAEKVEALKKPYLDAGFQRFGNSVLYSNGIFSQRFEVYELADHDPITEKKLVDDQHEQWLKDEEEKFHEKIKQDRFDGRVKQLEGFLFLLTDGYYKSTLIDYSISEEVVREVDDMKWAEYIQAIFKYMDELKEKERQAKMDDAQKVQDWVSKLNAIEPPIVNNQECISAIDAVRSAIRTVIATNW